MEILGIGPMELALIILLAIIIFGPKDIVKAGKSIGATLNKFIRSDAWKTINQTTQELKNLPTRLMREAGIEELEKNARQDLQAADQTIRQPVKAAPTPTDPSGVIPTPADPPDAGSAVPPNDKAPE